MKPEIFPNNKESNPQESLACKRLTSGMPTDIAIDELVIRDDYILITGGCNGLGYTLALVAAHAKANLILLDKSVSALTRLYDDIMAIDGAHEPFLLPIDLAGATLDDYLETEKALSQQIPKLDGIIHNAAYFSGLYSLLQTPPEALLQQIHVNYIAPIWLTQALFPLLKKSNTPTLLFADHQESYQANTAYWNTYAGSKLALMQAVKQIALEQGDSYQLIAYGYNTGWIDTNLARTAFPDGDADWALSQDMQLASQVLGLFNREAENASVITLPTS